MRKTREKITNPTPTISRPPIPTSWYKMAGRFKRERKALERHAKKIRAEWSRKSR